MPRSAGIKSQDVLVVGAGMGGISAAGKLQAEGHSVTLLEGRDRLGALADGDVC